MGKPGTFERVGDSDRKLYGPRGVLVCGVPAGEQEAVATLAKGGGLPVIFVSDQMAKSSLKQLLALEDGAGRGEESGLRRAVVMSGFSERELQWFMAAYRELGLQRPLWATLTKVSEKWTISRLLDELAAEDAEMARVRGGADG